MPVAQRLRSAGLTLSPVAASAVGHPVRVGETPHNCCSVIGGCKLPDPCVPWWSRCSPATRARNAGHTLPQRCPWRATKACHGLCPCLSPQDDSTGAGAPTHTGTVVSPAHPRDGAVWETVVCPDRDLTGGAVPIRRCWAGTADLTVTGQQLKESLPNPLSPPHPSQGIPGLRSARENTCKAPCSEETWGEMRGNRGIWREMGFAEIPQQEVHFWVLWPKNFPFFHQEKKNSISPPIFPHFPEFSNFQKCALVTFP